MNEQRLPRLEELIQTHQGQFYESGLALKQIRDEYLYRDLSFTSFRQYIEERWDMKRSHAYRLIQAATVMDNLSQIGDGFLPRNESQARVLARLKKDEQRSVWRGFISSGLALNAANIRKFINKQKKKRPLAKAPKNSRPIEVIDDDYKAAVMAMLEQIRKAKTAAWSSTSRQAALFWLNVMKESILAYDDGR